MKNLNYILLLISILSCNAKETGETRKSDTTAVSEPTIAPEASLATEANETDLIIGERIDGPANIRSKPNGEILFELYDDVLIEVSSKAENDWYEILVYADINYDEYPMDSILKNRPIIVNEDTIGKVLKSHYVNSGQGRDFAYAMLYGYTHKNNIKPETVIESVFKKRLTENGRDFEAWKWFIKAFKLDNDAIEFDGLESYYNYETSVDDPSPGFRMVLLFEKERLVGLIHSREIQIDDTKTHKLNWSYFVTFFKDYPEKGQSKFVDYMNEWIAGVD